MPLREIIERNKVSSAVIAGVVVIGSIGLAVFSLSDTASGTIPTQAYFSEDDGKTVFADSLDRLPPFDHNGKPAVRAMVYTTDGGKTRFVGYLLRFTPAALKALSDAAASASSGKPPKLTQNSAEIFLTGTEVKRPGDAAWVAPKDMAKRATVTNIAPVGGGIAESVSP